MGSTGALVPVTEGFTGKVTMRITHAGLATVVQYELREPSTGEDHGMRIA